MFLSILILLINSVFIKEIQSKYHGNYNDNSDEIVGGQTTTIQQHPYQANLVIEKDGGSFMCGGSIISARFILTAAHCLYGASQVHVRVGSSYYNSGGTEYTSTKVLLHSKYANDGTTDYDVALVDVGSMNLDGVTTKAVSLPTAGALVRLETNFVVTGWGYTTEDGAVSTQLMEVTVPKIAREDCSKSYAQVQLSVTERMFCAGLPQGGEDACQGDSGGPAVDTSSGAQVGVVSWGHGCARPGFPGVYADLTNNEIRSWINSNTGI